MNTPYLAVRQGQFWIIDDVGLQPLGDRCDVEVLNTRSVTAVNSRGDVRVMVEYTIKVADRTLSLIRSPRWARKYANFGVGHWTLTLIEHSSRHGTAHETKPIARCSDAATPTPTTPCPECNGTRRYVGLFETTPCHACCG